jgi:hypothetical protein
MDRLFPAIHAFDVQERRGCPAPVYAEGFAGFDLSPAKL